jgi:hypothetical protein
MPTICRHYVTHSFEVRIEMVELLTSIKCRRRPHSSAGSIRGSRKVSELRIFTRSDENHERTMDMETDGGAMCAGHCFSQHAGLTGRRTRYETRFLSPEESRTPETSSLARRIVSRIELPAGASSSFGA